MSDQSRLQANTCLSNLPGTPAAAAHQHTSPAAAEPLPTAADLTLPLLASPTPHPRPGPMATSRLPVCTREAATLRLRTLPKPLAATMGLATIRGKFKNTRKKITKRPKTSANLITCFAVFSADSGHLRERGIAITERFIKQKLGDFRKLTKPSARLK